MTDLEREARDYEEKARMLRRNADQRQETLNKLKNASEGTRERIMHAIRLEREQAKYADERAAHLRSQSRG